jgi:VanZ family protein
MNRFKWLTGVYITGLALITITANAGLGPVYFPLIYTIPGLDKVGHFVLVGLLSYLINRLFKIEKIRFYSWKILKGSLFVFLGVSLEEISQLFFVHRAFSWLDLASDLGGILVGGWLAGKLVNQQADRE